MRVSFLQFFDKASVHSRVASSFAAARDVPNGFAVQLIQLETNVLFPRLSLDNRHNSKNAYRKITSQEYCGRTSVSHGIRIVKPSVLVGILSRYWLPLVCFYSTVWPILCRKADVECGAPSRCTLRQMAQTSK